MLRISGATVLERNKFSEDDNGVLVVVSDNES